MAKEIRGNGWNLPTRQWELPTNEQVQQGYRTVKAESLEEATQFMKENYDNKMQTRSFGKVHYTSFNPCHHHDHREGSYSFIVFLTPLQVN